MTTNLNWEIANTIRLSDLQLTIDGRHYTSQEIASAYTTATNIWSFTCNIRKAINVGIFSYNIYLWQTTGWNPMWVIPVATTGFICLRTTAIYQRAVSWTLGWISGWNMGKTIRTGLLQARNESLMEVMSTASIMLGLSWQYSRLTWLMCMPMSIFRGLYYGLAIYGINYLLRAEIQRRIIDFLVETFSELGSDSANIMESLGIQQHTKTFEELVSLEEHHKSDSQPCSICLQNDRTQMARINECQHQFCEECLREWYKKPARVFNCPLCRINLDTPLDKTPIIRNLLTQLFG